MANKLPSDSIVHGNAFDALASLEEDAGHAAIVDYPWKFEAQNGTGRFGNDGDHGFDAYRTEDHERLADVLAELAESLVDGAWVFVFADDETSPEFRRLVEDSPFTYRRTLVWDREKFGMGTYHRVQHYPIIAATNGETERYVKNRGTVFRAMKHDGTPSTNDYPTAKPVKLYRQLLCPPVLEEGERLLEPFCGSGPGAAIAAERDLDYWGVDANPDAVDQARERLEQQRIGQVTL
ncbi:DNA methyltransferase [Halorubrum halodurans]|nr:DNA methyltransferase [Halorubrum halodurans]